MKVGLPQWLNHTVQEYFTCLSFDSTLLLFSLGLPTQLSESMPQYYRMHRGLKKKKQNYPLNSHDTLCNRIISR